MSPERLPRPMIAAGRGLRALWHRATIPLRYRYYVASHGAMPGLERLPAALRRLVGVDDADARTMRRVEIGSGPYPSPGFVHVDVDLQARHLEARAVAWELPFPDRWAREILAVHSLEHVPPPLLLASLREWHRVLEEGGHVEIHVPNTTELAAALGDADIEGKWRVMGALLGMYCSPTVSDPRELTRPADHQILFDAELLRWALEQTGYVDVEDHTADIVDRHTDAWREVVPHFSLVMRATRP
jgi:hypothetical protein